MEQKFKWPPLESSPEIFTEYMRKLGLPINYQFNEVFGFDEEMLAFVPQPVDAVILTYERTNKQADQENGQEENCVNYYMKQNSELDNACGVIACLHSIYNNDIDIDSQSVLGQFKAQNSNNDPMQKAINLQDYEQFKQIHQVYASGGQSKLCENQDQVCHHFVSFIKKGDTIYELDGLKKGPNIVATGDLLKESIKYIMDRLQKGEITESLSVMTLGKSE